MVKTIHRQFSSEERLFYVRKSWHLNLFRRLRWPNQSVSYPKDFQDQVFGVIIIMIISS